MATKKKPLSFPKTFNLRFDSASNKYPLLTNIFKDNQRYQWNSAKEISITIKDDLIYCRKVLDTCTNVALLLNTLIEFNNAMFQPGNFSLEYGYECGEKEYYPTIDGWRKMSPEEQLEADSFRKEAEENAAAILYKSKVLQIEAARKFLKEVGEL